MLHSNNYYSILKASFLIFNTSKARKLPLVYINDTKLNDNKASSKPHPIQLKKIAEQLYVAIKFSPVKVQIIYSLIKITSVFK